MMIMNLFSKRLKEENKKQEDVYVYDEVPEKLRNQIYHIWNDAIGSNDEVWQFIEQVMLKELGILRLTPRNFNTSKNGCGEFLLTHEDAAEVLDIIEISFVLINKEIRSQNLSRTKEYYGRKQEVDEAIQELNHRFKESDIGYEFIENMIIRVDKQYTHSEIIKPAIKLLHDSNFEGACNEFMGAHKKYREGNYKEAISNAQKSFESTIKTICERKKYPYNKEKDTSQKLINILFDNKIIPSFSKSHLESLEAVLKGVRSSLESGLPTLRNRKAGHGQGETVDYVPEQMVEYAINLAATNIVMLVELYNDIE